MGLFLGASVITLVELLQYFIIRAWTCAKHSCKRSNYVMDVASAARHNDKSFADTK